VIKRLSEELVNKIAAGEVVERPVNVVKELVENAIDAKATIINVTIAENLIKIEDNGEGMLKEDLKNSILRHATSKISDFEDLKLVQSFGFRGEALSSIAAVSDFRIVSRHESSLEGAELIVEGGKFKFVRSVGCSPGTTIEVRNLFFNTPVRKKFLDNREENRIIGFIEKFALGADAKITLNRNGKKVVDVSSSRLIDRIAQVYGIDIVKHMREVKYSNSGVKVSGYVSSPSYLRRDRMMQAIFVNKRLVESSEINKGMYEAYKSILFVQKHPVAILNVKITEVDVNVHPAKKIVKFTDPELVKKAVYNSIHEVFANKMEIFEAQHTFEGDFENIPVAVIKPLFTQISSRFQKETQEEFGFSKIEKSKLNDNFKKLPIFRLIGNVAKSFFLAEGDEELYLIDQHVVDERINYEKFMEQHMGNKVEKQFLLVPKLLEFNSSDSLKLLNNIDKIKNFGYELENFGENMFRLTTVPLLFNKVMDVAYMIDLLADFKEVRKEKIVTRMACRNAIKAGDVVSNHEMYNLLKELDKCELPFTCPHGRPTIVKISLEDIEKMFRRKGFN
jgi:DNA mismatch repair protein MutL